MDAPAGGGGEERRIELRRVPGGVPVPKPRPRVLTKRERRGRKLRRYFEQRRIAFARDRHRCVVCGRWARETHHIIPRSCGGSDEAWNLASVCVDRMTGGCHRLATGHVIKMRGNADRWEGEDALVIEMWQDAASTWVPQPRFLP
jgi:hypothetical protein